METETRVLGGNMKKHFAFGLISLLCLSVIGCGKEPVKHTDDNNQAGHNPDVVVTTSPDDSKEKTVYDLYISEVMADNTDLCLGTDADWIEIGSHEENVVSLNGYYLTDNPEEPKAYPLEGNVIAENGYVVVLLTADAPFHLSADGETVYLMCNNTTVNELTYGPEIGNRSASADGVLSFATPGFPNTQEGYEKYLAGARLPNVMFSEAMSSNTKYAGQNGEYYDFVELQNNSTETVNLSDFYLSDKKNNMTMYRMPDISLAPGEYYVIYCSGLEQPGHAPFKISSSGEDLYLTDGTVLLDKLRIPGDLEQDKSYGRIDRQFVYMEEPTPGEANRNGYAARVQIPTPNKEPGLYDSAISVELQGEGTIYYTLDGSHPTEQSAVYNGPISIDKVTTVRTFAKSGERVSELGSYTYLVGIDHTLPVVYVSIPDRYISGDDGIIKSVSKTIEKECVLSLYEDGEMKFSVPCGFRLHGNDSRKGAKQNFQLRFRSEYGLGKLHCKLFADSDIEQFDSLLLKGGSEDYNRAMVRDEFCTGLVDGETHLYVLDCKPCVLYLGDQYWGVYYLRERFSDDYVADHFDVSSKSVDLLYSYGGVQNGSAKDYNALISYCKNHDLSVDENYRYVTERVDVVSLMDWYICRSYLADTDYANIRYFRTTEYDGKWRWMFFDLDWSFEPANEKKNYLEGIIKFDKNHDNILFSSLLKNKEFKDAFIKRYAELMKSILNEEHINAELDKFVAVIEPEMEADRSRWGCSMKGWQNSLQTIRNFIKDGKRNKHMMNEIKTYFGLSDEQMTGYFGLDWK